MANTSVITNYRRTKLCQITSGNITTIAKITHVAFGNRGVDSGGEPLTPASSQTSLNNEIARYPIDSVEYTIPTTARYKVTIPANALVGQKISEAGLIDQAGNLCAVKNMYEKVKDGDTSFTFTFDDEF